jgi:hypothetical protein
MAGIAGWFGQHGYDVISAVGIIAGLGYTAASFRADTRSRRLANLVQLTQQHREIWEELLAKPQLVRIKDSKADLYTKPISPEEFRFVTFLIMHLHCWYRALLGREVSGLEGLTRDMKAFFSLPIPSRVWQECRAFYDADFVDYVERAVGLK